MKRVYFAVILLPMVGCAARRVPAVVAAPTAVPTATPRVVIAPPLPTPATPTPDPKRARLLAIVNRELQRLKSASPEQDVAAAWAAQNTKFVALLGVGWHIPGVPKDRVMALLNKYDATPIEGTTDVMEFPEQAELGRLALEYATRYNQLLLAKLDAQNAARSN